MSQPDPTYPPPPGTGGYPVQPGPYPNQPGAHPARGYPTGGYPHQGATGYPTGGYPQYGSGQFPKVPYPPRQRPPRQPLPGVAVLIAIVAISAVGTVVLLLNRKGSTDPDTVAATTGIATTLPGQPTQTTPSLTTPPAGNPTAQARGIDALLTDSQLGRDRLGAAIVDINACRVTSLTYDNINAAITNRSSLIRSLDSLAVDALPDGPQLKAELRLAFSGSYDADMAYLQWVQAAGSACPRTTDPAFGAVEVANSRASQAKATFVARWNPVAQLYGLPTRSAGEI